MAQENVALIIDCSTGEETVVKLSSKDAQELAEQAAQRQASFEAEAAAQVAVEAARAEVVQRAKEAGLSDEDIALLSGA